MILCPVMMVWWLSDFLGGGAMACVRATPPSSSGCCSGMVLGECSFLRRTTTKRRSPSSCFSQVRFECPAARAKAVGEERPSVRSSLCPSIYYERLASRGQRRPASRVGCPAGPSQTGQHEAAAASTGLRPLASVPVVWTWWWWLFSSMHKCRTVF